ncbi:HTH lysR-type domain-containing protein, partial [Dysosmobacter welbionis]
RRKRRPSRRRSGSWWRSSQPRTRTETSAWPRGDSP